MQTEADAVYAGAAQIFYLQHLRPLRNPDARVLLVQLAANHHFDQAIFVDIADRVFADPFAIAQYGDPVADLEDFLQPMRDVDDAATIGTQLFNHPEQGAGFGIGQGIGGLVHDDDVRLERQRLGDFHHLLGADAEITDPGLGRLTDLQPIQQYLGVGVEPGPVDFAEGIDRLATEKNVLGNGQLVQQVQFLMNDADTGLLRVARTLETAGLATITDLAGIRLIDTGQYLHHGGFTGAILAHQRHHLARIHVEPGLIQRLDAGKGLVDAG